MDISKVDISKSWITYASKTGKCMALQQSRFESFAQSIRDIFLDNSTLLLFFKIPLSCIGLFSKFLNIY